MGIIILSRLRFGMPLRGISERRDSGNAKGVYHYLWGYSIRDGHTLVTSARMADKIIAKFAYTREGILIGQSPSVVPQATLEVFSPL